MPEAWSAKRERQYQHIKDGQLDKGVPEDEAEEHEEEPEAEDEAAGFSLEDEEELLEQAARVPARASVARAAPTRNRERFIVMISCACWLDETSVSLERSQSSARDWAASRARRAFPKK